MITVLTGIHTAGNLCCLWGGELKILMTLVAASDLPAVTAISLTSKNTEYQKTNMSPTFVFSNYVLSCFHGCVVTTFRLQ